MNVYGWRLSLFFALGLHASVVPAQEIVIPDTRELQSMSIEEYETYREQLRIRMESAPAAAPVPAQEPAAAPPPDRAEKRGGGYGQGYGTRHGQNSMSGRQGGFGRGGGGRRR